MKWSLPSLKSYIPSPHNVATHYSGASVVVGTVKSDIIMLYVSVNYRSEEGGIEKWPESILWGYRCWGGWNITWCCCFSMCWFTVSTTVGKPWQSFGNSLCLVKMQARRLQNASSSDDHRRRKKEKKVRQNDWFIYQSIKQSIKSIDRPSSSQN